MDQNASTIAAEIIQTTAPITTGHIGNGGAGVEFIERRIYEDLLTKAKLLAETFASPRGATGNFLDRLKTEHAHLTGKHDALTMFIQRGAPGVSDYQRALLNIQLNTMGGYRRVLEMRLADLDRPKTLQEIADERAVASERVIGEPQETGGHDEDRDGPIPFGG